MVNLRIFNHQIETLEIAIADYHRNLFQNSRNDFREIIVAMKEIIDSYYYGSISDGIASSEMSLIIERI
jgi:hypothetical protein